MELTAQPLCVCLVMADGAEMNIPTFDNDVVLGISEVYLGRWEKWGWLGLAHGLEESVGRSIGYNVELGWPG